MSVGLLFLERGEALSSYELGPGDVVGKGRSNPYKILVDLR